MGTNYNEPINYNANIPYNGEITPPPSTSGGSGWRKPTEAELRVFDLFDYKLQQAIRDDEELLIILSA